MKREIRLLLLMCLVVCACAWLCIWVSTSVIAAFVLTAPPRWKITFFTVGSLVSHGLHLVLGDPLSTACWHAFCSCLEILITVLPFKHFAVRTDITNRRAICRIVYFGVLLAPLTGALLGSGPLAATAHRPYPEVVRFWFLSESLGASVGLSVTLLLLTRPPGRPFGILGARAFVAWSSPLVLVTLAVFWQTTYPLAFLVLPPLVVLLFRFELAGAVFGTSFIVVVAGIFTAEGHGPFRVFLKDAPLQQVALYHVFGLTLFATFISVGFAIQERVKFERALKDANLRLNYLASHDPLTGIRNRRGFDEMLNAEWLNSLPGGETLSLLYIDIDYFKRFNDTYGHLAGDECLRTVAAALLGGVRSSRDWVARYGGEEFVIGLPATSAAEALVTANRVVAMVHGAGIPHRDSPFAMITASVGVATLHPASGGSPAELVHLADQALYTAKRKGRNCIEVNRGNETCELRLAERTV
jgi:diguanylate cyclase (GGDEF)-like protein